MNIFNRDLISKNTSDLIFLLYKQNLLKAKTHNTIQDFDFSSFNNVLVFSPHMDDEIIGSGNFLLEYTKKAENNRKLTICYLIDNDGKKYKKRILESEKVCKKLNAKRLCFNFKDSALDYDVLFQKLTDLIYTINPQLILFSDFSLGNAHPDHDMLAKAIHKIMSNFPKIQFLGYEVLCPIESNCKLSLNSNAKIKLLKIYKSQIKKINYIKFLKKRFILEGNFNEHYILYTNNTCKL